MRILRSAVWELLGLTGHRPGSLTLERGVIAFETDQGVRFNCAVKDLKDVKWPWYSFNAALHLTVKDARYRLSFARPNGAGAAWFPEVAAEGILDLGGAIKTGRAWRTAIEQGG